jgi:hypothetical protein
MVETVGIDMFWPHQQTTYSCVVGPLRYSINVTLDGAAIIVQ